MKLQAVERQREGIVAFTFRVVGAEDQQLRRTDRGTLRTQDGHLHTALQAVVPWPPAITEHAEELPEPVTLVPQARVVPSLALNPAADLHVVAGQSAERVIGGTSPLATVCRRLAPARHRLPDVTAQYLGEIVIAVELVLVADAGEGGRPLGGHLLSPLPPTRTRP